MTAEDRQKIKERVEATKSAHQKLLKLFGAAICRGNYYKMRYHDTRVALIECRLDNRGLEDMVAALQKQVGDNGPDLKLGDDLDVA